MQILTSRSCQTTGCEINKFVFRSDSIQTYGEIKVLAHYLKIKCLCLFCFFVLSLLNK